MLNKKPYTALYEAGKMDFKATEYHIAKRRAVFNQRKYGKLVSLLSNSY